MPQTYERPGTTNKYRRWRTREMGKETRERRKGICSREKGLALIERRQMRSLGKWQFIK